MNEKRGMQIVVPFEGSVWIVLLGKTASDVGRMMVRVLGDEEVREVIQRALDAGGKWAGAAVVPYGGHKGRTLHEVYCSPMGERWLRWVVDGDADPRTDPFREIRGAVEAYVSALDHMAIEEELDR